MPEDQQKQEDPKKKKSTPKWVWVVIAAVAAVAVGVVLGIILLPHSDQKTDDAYVTAHYAVIAPRIGGQVSQVLVADNQAVSAGQPLALIDDRDQRATLMQSEAALAVDQARALEADADLLRQPAVIREDAAQVASARARLQLAAADAARFARLSQTGAGTLQQHQEANATLREDEAALKSAEARLSASRTQERALRAALEAARARVSADEAQTEQARLNLSYTRVLAPMDGVVDQRSLQVGDYVSPGSPVMVVVPLDRIFVTANYREGALRHMRPGQPVRIHVDTYRIELRGVVDSLPASSGAAFLPIPPNNASGNFTKIVQRFPVKIVFDAGQPLVRLVRVGMSVETTVDTRLENLVREQQQSPERVTGRPE